MKNSNSKIQNSSKLQASKFKQVSNADSQKLGPVKSGESVVHSAKNCAYPRHLENSWALSEDSGPESTPRREFDLEERTASFGENVVRFCKRVPRNPTSDPLVQQRVRAGTSVGANYIEASERVSKKDFRFSISRCVKEAKETKYFLRMIAAAESALAPEARQIYREAHELHLIFATIYRK
jgi:four helix bundle protein